MTYRLKINGVTVATPIEDGIKISDEPVWADGAGRNIESGEMIATLVCWKRQVEITWGTLTSAQALTILNAIKSGGSFFWIEYNDIDAELFDGQTHSSAIYPADATYPNTSGQYAKIKVYTSSVPRTISTLANSNNNSKKRIKDVTITFTEK